jgi:CO/xanthine dehydrogenase Mo-binding subunit
MTLIAPARTTYGVIGTDTPRTDAVAKVQGEAQFAGDLRFHGMAYGRVLRSPYAHARIVAIDGSAAEALPGVIAVMTVAIFPRQIRSTATPLRTGLSWRWRLSASSVNRLRQSLRNRQRLPTRRLT